MFGRPLEQRPRFLMGGVTKVLPLTDYPWLQCSPMYGKVGASVTYLWSGL